MKKLEKHKGYYILLHEDLIKKMSEEAYECKLKLSEYIRLVLTNRKISK